MTSKNFRRLVKKWNGWIVGGIAYFPTVWHREQFEREATQ